MILGLPGRLVAAWRDPAASWQSEFPAGEPRLLAYAFGASLFLTVARIGVELAAPTVSQGVEGPAWLAAQVLAGFSFLPLALYGVAALIALLCRALGGGGDWAGTRLAFFWSGFAAGPVAFGAQILITLVGFGAWASAAGGVVWFWLLVPMLAAAHGFSVLRVGLALAAFTGAVFLLRAVG